MSEYEFVLGHLLKVLRASELDNRAKQIMAYRIIEIFELTETYLNEKKAREHQKTFVKDIED